MTGAQSTLPQLRSASLGRLLRQREYGVLGLLVLTLIAVGVTNPAFLAASNLSDILVDSVRTVIVACGLTFVVVLGEIDISMGSLLSLLATVMGWLTSPTYGHLPVVVGIAITLALGAGVGLINGVLVAYGRMPSIIVTLGMMTVLSGINLTLFTVIKGGFITDMPPGLRFLGVGRLLGIPVSVLTAALVVALTIFLARQTPLGRRLYAAGSSPEAARLAGLNVRGLKLFAFTLTGFLVGIAAAVSVPHLGTIQNNVGDGFELLVVTCVVVGGTSLSGGRGTIVGSVLAALLLALVSPMLIFLRLGVSATYWERAIQGAFILTAVLLDHASRRHQGGHK
jgi:ribose/xylose/arabinose/galactoside ABC-type transport system permease subunit